MMLATNTASFTDAAAAPGGDRSPYGSLQVIGKDGVEGKKFDITGDVTIGRSAKCDLRIRNESVSRVHAQITIDQNG